MSLSSHPTVSASRPAPVDATMLARITQHLGYEAMLLDERRFDEWLATLDEAIIYEIPLRVVAGGQSGENFPAGYYRARDTIGVIRKRVERGKTGEAWAEDPPSSTVRSVSSVFAEATEQAECFLVHSSLLVYRQRASERACDLIPARRRDILRVEPDRCVLTRRTVLLAEAIVQTPNLGIFL